MADLSMALRALLPLDTGTVAGGDCGEENIFIEGALVVLVSRPLDFRRSRRRLEPELTPLSEGGTGEGCETGTKCVLAAETALGWLELFTICTLPLTF